MVDVTFTAFIATDQLIHLVTAHPHAPASLTGISLTLTPVA